MSTLRVLAVVAVGAVAVVVVPDLVSDSDDQSEARLGTVSGVGQATAPVAGPSGVSDPEQSAAIERPPLLDDEVPRHLSQGWSTDFSIHSVPFSEIRSGGPPPDGIPPIDRPKFIDVANPPDYMDDDEPVIGLEVNGDARAYPLAILISHEIVNDVVGDIPVSITYCPLCNTAIVFGRRVAGRVLDFGTSGNLRKSDLVMWDRQTQSWWQQITGEAIVGELTGAKLDFLPAPVVSWGQFRDSYADGLVLSRDTGFRRNYDRPPYSGYDDLGNNPFLFFDEVDSRLPAMERVVSVSVESEHVAFPFQLLEEHPVVNDNIGGQDVVIFYSAGTLSPFAGRRGPARPIGSTAVYEPFVDGEQLSFTVEDGIIVDRQTGSKWTVLGDAVEGPLEGSRLTPVVHGNHFWFAWSAFNPETEVRTTQDVSRNAGATASG